MSRASHTTPPSQQIGIGDLVMFVRSCCDGFRDGVLIFRVESIKPTRPAGRCSTCWRPLPHDRYAADNPTYGGAPLQWLKKIDPPAEPERIETEETIDA